MTQHAQLSAFGLFDTAVPRYTSYPPATQFAPDIGPECMRQWLAALPPAATISLYVHIPFCRRLCWFCACRTQGTSTLSPVAAYVKTLLAEIDLLRANLPTGIRLSRLHWGGGTPTLLSPDLITSLANQITSAFPLTDTAEFSVEIDPSEVDDARLDALVAAGMNRASLGVQDFDPLIQRAIGRIQPFELTAEVVSGLRSRGVGDINIDMLYGLPHQTLKGIARSVEQVQSLEPQRVALYGYAHVPWVSRRQQMIPEANLPLPENRLDLYLQASDQFALAGYIPIGIDHFAKADDNLARAAEAGRLRRNFQGYTDDDSSTLIGMGASAISRLPQGYAQNASATAAYTQAIRGAQLATHRGYALQAEDHLRARLIEMVMCYGVIDTAVLAIEFPGSDQITASICDRIIARFGMFLRHEGPRLVLTEEGRPLTRLVARMCDGFVESATRGSSAI